MNFENKFAVDAPIGDVWETLMDIERVAPCMPGAEVLERLGEDIYKVGIKVKLGPISMQYRGDVAVVERDDAARQAAMHVKAKESRGQGTADARVHMSLAVQDGATQATIDTQLQISGKAAAMGRGMIADVAEKLVETFAANLAEMLAAPVGGGAAAPTPAAPAPAAAAPAGEAAGVGAAGNGAGAPQGAPAVATAEAPPAAAQAPQATEPAPPGAAPAGEPPPPRRAAPAQEALPAGQIAASVIAGRLSNPRTLLLATAALAAVSFAIGYAIGRSR